MKSGYNIYLYFMFLHIQVIGSKHSSNIRRKRKQREDRIKR